MVDEDEDEVGDPLEDGVPDLNDLGGSSTGDGNGDGIPDRQQADVASLPNAVDGGYLTLVSNNGSRLQAVKAISPTIALPPGLSVPQGLISFQSTALGAGASYSVTLILHTGTPPDSYWKYGPTPDDPTDHWYDFDYDGETGAIIAGKRITLYFVDGKRGDADLNANGSLRDPGGPVQRIVYRAWLPQIVGQEQKLSDLIVERLTAGPNGVEVVLQNRGNAPVVDEFWVDAYLAPSTPPTAVNQLWNDLSQQGLVWGVTASALPILPGQRITLRVGDGFYSPAHSYFTGGLPVGTPVYAQVDSWNPATTFGAVLESHEALGGVYNNIASATVTAEGVRSASVTPASQVSFEDLPARPLAQSVQLWLPTVGR